MEKGTQNILIITESTSYIVTSMAQQLAELGYATIQVKPDADEISRVKDSLSTILVYVNEAVLENVPMLVYIKDRLM